VQQQRTARLLSICPTHWRVRIEQTTTKEMKEMSGARGEGQEISTATLADRDAKASQLYLTQLLKMNIEADRK
jgi:hypothetical protein